MRLADELHEGSLVVLPEAGQLACGRVLAARQLQSHLETKIIVWLPLCNIAINERDDNSKIADATADEIDSSGGRAPPAKEATAEAEEAAKRPSPPARKVRYTYDVRMIF